ncbi:hypothetical protein FXO38_05226 [Capsicum annuum]|nr:hypothetical protein FXO38_05226 [Capsicum annuum]
MGSVFGRGPKPGTAGVGEVLGLGIVPSLGPRRERGGLGFRRSPEPGTAGGSSAVPILGYEMVGESCVVPILGRERIGGSWVECGPEPVIKRGGWGPRFGRGPKPGTVEVDLGFGCGPELRSREWILGSSVVLSLRRGYYTHTPYGLSSVLTEVCPIEWNLPTLRTEVIGGSRGGPEPGTVGVPGFGRGPEPGRERGPGFGRGLEPEREGVLGSGVVPSLGSGEREGDWVQA